MRNKYENAGIETKWRNRQISCCSIAGNEIPVRIVVRETAIIPQIKNHTNIEIVKGNVDNLDIHQIKQRVQEGDSIICCFGLNISFKGMFGHPKRLVLNAV